MKKLLLLVPILLLASCSSVFLGMYANIYTLEPHQKLQIENVEQDGFNYELKNNTEGDKVLKVYDSNDNLLQTLAYKEKISLPKNKINGAIIENPNDSQMFVQYIAKGKGDKAPKPTIKYIDK